MKTIISLLISFSAYFALHLADLEAQSPDAKQHYKVHREYDEQGNLIHYDSSYVSVWSSDSSDMDLDSLDYLWDKDTYLSDSDSFVHNDPFFFGFRFPGDEFFFLPDIDFGRELEDFDRIMKEFHGDMLPYNKDLESQITEMEKRMEEMRLYHEKIFREFFERDFDDSLPSPIFPDSIPKPDISPGPEPQRYDSPRIPI